MDRQTVMTFHHVSTWSNVYDEDNMITYTDENCSVFGSGFDSLDRKTTVFQF